MEMCAIQSMHCVVQGWFPYDRYDQCDHPETIAAENVERSLRLPL